MASFGDIYNFAVNVSINGVADVADFRTKTQQLKDSMAELTLMFRQGRISADQYRETMRLLRQQSKDFHQLGRSLGDVTSGSNRAAQSMMTLTYVMDDASYGARGLINNIPMVTTALFGFGMAGAAAGAVGTILAAAFRDQIDSALAYAGILDANLVKAMDRAESKSNQFKEALAALREEFEDSPKATREMAGSVAGAFEDAGRVITEGVSKMISDAGLDEEIAARRKELQDQIKQLVSQVTADNAVAIDRQIGALEKRLADLTKEEGDRLKAAGEELRKLQEQAIQGDQEALQRLSDKAFEAFERTRDGTYVELAQQLFELTDSFKAAEDDARILNIQLAKSVQHTKEVAEANELIRKTEEEVAKAIDRRVDMLDDADTAQRKLTTAMNAARAAADRGNKEEVAAHLDRAKRHQERLAMIEAEVAAEEQKWQAIEAARKAAEDAERDATTDRVVKALGGRLDADIAGALQGRVMAGQGLGQVGVGGATDAVAGQVVQQLVRSGVSVDAARQAAQHLVEEQATAIQAVVDSNNLNFRLNQQMIQGMDAFRQQQEQYRRMLIQLMQHNARQSRRGRANMLGTFRPF